MMKQNNLQLQIPDKGLVEIKEQDSGEHDVDSETEQAIKDMQMCEEFDLITPLKTKVTIFRVNYPNSSTTHSNFEQLRMVKLNSIHLYNLDESMFQSPVILNKKIPTGRRDGIKKVPTNVLNDAGLQNGSMIAESEM